MVKKLLTNRPTGSLVTYFYTNDKKQIKQLLTELGLMDNAVLETKQSRKQIYLSFSNRLTDEQLQVVKSRFIDKTQPKKLDVISGFTGNLITEFNYF